MRNLITMSGLIAMIMFAGCTKSETGGTESPAKEGTSETVADQGAKKEANDEYPYEELISSVGIPELTNAYKMCEDSLRANPDDPQERMQKSFLLLNAGARLTEAEKDKALLAYRAAMENAEELVKDHPELPQPYHQVLANVYYNGACAEALDGKAESAKTILEKAIQWGWSDMDQLQEDPDLASVRALPGFDAQVEAWIQAAREAALESAREELANGETFPFDFTVTDITGAEIKLADLKGKVAIVDIWGTWCPPCREEIPSFIKLQDKYGEQGLQIVGLNYENPTDDEAKMQLVKDYVEGNGINYPCALGSEEIQAQVPDFRGFPTTIFVDRSGKVRLKLVGLHEYSLLDSLVETLLAEEAPVADEAETPTQDTPADEETAETNAGSEEG